MKIVAFYCQDQERVPFKSEIHKTCLIKEGGNPCPFLGLIFLLEEAEGCILGLDQLDPVVGLKSKSNVLSKSLEKLTTKTAIGPQSFT
ncbi:MAG: hypothetical protein ABH831_02005 [Candidatus Nealsonbacteria bacterium]